MMSLIALLIITMIATEKLYSQWTIFVVDRYIDAAMGIFKAAIESISTVQYWFKKAFYILFYSCSNLFENNTDNIVKCYICSESGSLTDHCNMNK